MDPSVEVSFDPTASWHVPVVFPDLSQLDCLEDQGRQALLEGKLKEFIQQQVDDLHYGDMARMLGTLLSLLRDSSRPQLLLDCLSYAASLTSDSMPDIAKRHGCDKQLASYYIKALQSRFNLGRTRCQRSAAARAAMAASYRERHASAAS